MKPTIGRTVTYRSRTGDYDVPAIVAGTVDTVNPKNVEAGYLPGLSSENHVHLVVFTPGPPGKRASATDFKVESEHGRSENVAGCYQEWDIPCWEPPNVMGGPGIPAPPAVEPEPGTWRWPELVTA